MIVDWVAAPRRKLGAVPPRRGAAGPRGESGGGFSGFVSPANICKSRTSIGPLQPLWPMISLSCLRRPNIT